MWAERCDRLQSVTCYTQATKWILTVSCFVPEAAEIKSPSFPEGLVDVVFLQQWGLLRVPGEKEENVKFPNLSERSIKVPMHWFWPQIFSAQLPLHAPSQTLLSRLVSCGSLQCPWILFNSAGTLGGGGVSGRGQWPAWCTQIDTGIGGVGCGDGGQEVGRGKEGGQRGGPVCGGALHCPPEGTQGFEINVLLSAAYPQDTLYNIIHAPVSQGACLRAPVWGQRHRDPPAPPVPFTSVLSANTQRPSPNSCGPANLRLISHQGLTPTDLWALHPYCSQTYPLPPPQPPPPPPPHHPLLMNQFQRRRRTK